MASTVPKSPTFLSLPLEIRREIYLHLLLRPRSIDTNYGRFFPNSQREGYPNGLKNTSIFRVSKQISEESLDVFYRENVFVVELQDGRECEWDVVTERNRARIRRVEIWIRSMIPMPRRRRPFRFDDACWVPILQNLLQMYIVVMPPPKVGWFSSLYERSSWEYVDKIKSVRSAR